VGIVIDDAVIVIENIFRLLEDKRLPPREAAVQGIAGAYARAGLSARFASRFYDVPHEFNVQMQEDAFAWLDEHLRPAR